MSDEKKYIKDYLELLNQDILNKKIREKLTNKYDPDENNNINKLFNQEYK